MPGLAGHPRLDRNSQDVDGWDVSDEDPLRAFGPAVTN
jgi:hypothetical protein